MNPRSILYGLLCALALCYVLLANARAYIPFATPIGRAAQTTPNHFHK
jgi:hypothetical protein